MDIVLIISLLAVGGVVGFLAGLLGIGGGMSMGGKRALIRLSLIQSVSSLIDHRYLRRALADMSSLK